MLPSRLQLGASLASLKLRGWCQKQSKKRKTKRKTYNSRDSLVVTHPTTNQPACGLSTAERTGSPVFHTLWSYVLGKAKQWVVLMKMESMDDGFYESLGL